MMEKPSESWIYLDLPDGLPSSFPDRETMERATHIIMEQLIGEERVESPLEVSLSIVDDGEIRELNREYRGKDQATDVLSFPQADRIPKSVQSLRGALPGDREDRVL